GELDHQLGALGAGGIVCGTGLDLVDAAVGQAQRDVELGGRAGLAGVVPDAGDDLVAHGGGSVAGRWRRCARVLVESTMKLEKVTSIHGRRYDDACGTALGLEILGERWALLVVRELMLGARRFGELRASLPGLSANVLTQRLEGLEAAGVLVPRKLPPPASVQVYELTPWGYEAEPVILSLGRWAARSPDHDPTLPLSPVSMMLSLRAMFDPARAGDALMAVGFRFGETDFRVCVA